MSRYYDKHVIAVCAVSPLAARLQAYSGTGWLSPPPLSLSLSRRPPLRRADKPLCVTESTLSRSGSGGDDDDTSGAGRVDIKVVLKPNPSSNCLATTPTRCLFVHAAVITPMYSRVTNRRERVDHDEHVKMCADQVLNGSRVETSVGQTLQLGSHDCFGSDSVRLFFTVVAHPYHARSTVTDKDVLLSECTFIVRIDFSLGNALVLCA